MKKLFLITAMALAASIAEAQQVVTKYTFNDGTVVTTIDNVVLDLVPVGQNAGELIGFSITFSSPEIDPGVQFGYTRNGIDTIIYSSPSGMEVGGTTFSWEPNLTGGWILIPGDVLFCRGGEVSTAQITYVINKNLGN